MASSFEKSVKGGTKIKLAPPKSKYVEHILIATHAGEAGVAEVFRSLQNRLRDSTWTVVFKSLIIIHMMIREGEPDVTLKHLSVQPARKLAISNFTEVQTQGRNIRAYSEYLLERAKSYASAKVDFVRNGEGRLKRLSIDKGLLRETELVQDQIRALVRCDLLTNEPENEITLVAFRLLTMDLLVLFHIMNEATINVLEHYFEMSHPDAERALNIYKVFCKQTGSVVQFLSVARAREHSTRLEIPKIKHAPTSLSKSLEDYLNDPDFETTRRQYVAQKDAKRGGGNTIGQSASASQSVAARSEPKPSGATSAPTQASRPSAQPAPDLIDFFESIEHNQQPLGQPGPQPQFQQPFVGQQPQPGAFQQPNAFQQQQPGMFQAQNTGMPQQQQQQQQQPFNTGTNPFGQSQLPMPQQQQPLQPTFTGAGFGGYTPQPQGPAAFSPPSTLQSIPQNGVADFAPQSQAPPQPHFSNMSSISPPAALQPQSTNPFRQSMLPAATGALSPAGNTGSLNRSPTNPFARQAPNPGMPPQQAPNTGFVGAHAPRSPPSFVQSPPPAQPLLPAPTGTNPFARNASPAQPGGLSPPPQQPASLMPNPTGSTNPFRQSAFVNQQTGQGWQSGQQGTMGGLENLETVPVFPRPGQAPLPPHGQSGGWS